MTVAEYKIRTVIILILLLIWAAGAAVKVYIYSVKEQKDLLKKSRRIAWRVAEIPARRGRILDRNGSWIYETLQVVRQPENGRDVRLSETIEELEKRGEAGK